MFKVNNKDIRASFWCSIVNFEPVIAGWENYQGKIFLPSKMIKVTTTVYPLNY